MVKYGKNDLVWMLSKSLHNFSLLIQTWASCNSLISKEHPTTSFFTLPLVNSSPTDFSNLYTALRIVRGISVVQALGRKTIVSLDLQLYAICIQFQSKQDLRFHYVFRLGELHVVFAMLKAVGKYIDASGLASAFIEEEIPGPGTVEQVKAGKRIKRSVTAYLILYLAHFRRYIEKLI